MRLWIVIAILGVALAGGGGYYGLAIYPQHQFRAGLDQAIATLPPGTQAAYRDAHYGVFDHRSTITGVTGHFVLPIDPPEPVDVTIDRIETTNPNLDFSTLWAKAQANPEAQKPDQALAVADSITVTGVTLRSARFNMTAASSHLTNLRLFPWALLHDGMPSLRQISAALTPKEQVPSLPDMQIVLRAEAGLLLGFAYDSYEANSVSWHQSLAGVDVGYDVVKMTGAPADRGIMKGATVEGIRLQGSKLGAFSADRATMGEIELRAPMTRLMNNEPLSMPMLNGMKIGRIEYAGIVAQPPGAQPVRMASFGIGPIVFADGVPVSGQIGWREVSVAKAAIPEPRARETLEKLGLDTVTISFGIAYTWDLPQKKASVNSAMLTVKELGALILSLDVADLDNKTETFDQVKLAHAKLRFEDASLVDRALRASAAESGTDVDTYRKQIVALVRTESEALVQGSAVATQIGQAASDFIAAPKSLTIELAPPTPLSADAVKGALSDPAGLLPLLGLTVTANQP